MGTKQSLFFFLVLIFFPVALGFMAITPQELKMKFVWALVISVSLAALIAGDA